MAQLPVGYLYGIQAHGLELHPELFESEVRKLESQVHCGQADLCSLKASQIAN